LERELATLRDVALRQRGEVQWLSSVKAASIQGLEEESPNAAIFKKRQHEEEEKAKREDIEDFTRRLRLLQQRERDFDKERENVLERERAVRDQELQLALEHERQQVRSLLKERALEQREWQLERGLSAQDCKLEKETQSPLLEEGGKLVVPLGSAVRPMSRTFVLGSGSAVDTEPEAEAEADVEMKSWQWLLWRIRD
jgi:hypothetical protein